MTEQDLIKLIQDSHSRETEILEFKEAKKIPFERDGNGSDEVKKRKCIYGYCATIGYTSDDKNNYNIHQRINNITFAISDELFPNSLRDFL
jgi:hypothetical protein